MVRRSSVAGIATALATIISLSSTARLSAHPESPAEMSLEDSTIGDSCGTVYNPPSPEVDANPYWHGGAVPLEFPDIPASHDVATRQGPSDPAKVLNLLNRNTRHDRSTNRQPLSEPGYEVEMKLLLLSATRSNNLEPALRLVKEALEGLGGIPYEHINLTKDGQRISTDPLDLEFPASGGKRRGKYYGIVLISDLLAFQDKEGTWLSSLTWTSGPSCGTMKSFFTCVALRSPHIPALPTGSNHRESR